MLTGNNVPIDASGQASLETSEPGVFALGDVRAGSVKRVGSAIGEGAGLVAQIHQYLGTSRSAPMARGPSIHLRLGRLAAKGAAVHPSICDATRPASVGSRDATRICAGHLDRSVRHAVAWDDTVTPFPGLLAGLEMLLHE